MPAKKGLFDVTGSEPPREKKPTLKQWLKTNAKPTFPILSRIEVIWYPGTFDNYSFELELFRLSISPNHPLFEILERNITKFCMDSETALLVSVEDEKPTIRLVESTIYGTWERIGNAGFKFTPTDGAN